MVLKTCLFPFATTLNVDTKPVSGIDTAMAKPSHRWKCIPLAYKHSQVTLLSKDKNILQASLLLCSMSIETVGQDRLKDYFNIMNMAENEWKPIKVKKKIVYCYGF